MLIEILAIAWASIFIFAGLGGKADGMNLIGIGIGVPVLLYGVYDFYTNGIRPGDLRYALGGLAGALLGLSLRRRRKKSEQAASDTDREAPPD